MASDGVVESPKKWSLSYWNDDIANVVMGGMQDADALLLGPVSTRDSPRPGPTTRSRTIPVRASCQREEVRGVTHLDQPVRSLMGTPTEVPLVMDRSTRALTVGYDTERTVHVVFNINYSAPLTILPAATEP